MIIRLSIKKVTVFLIALSPFLVNYELPILHINLTLIIYMTITLYEILNLLNKNFMVAGKLKCQFSCSYLLVYMLIYLLFESFYVKQSISTAYSLVQIGLLYIQIMGLISFFSDKHTRDLYKRYICNITMVMCSVIFIQYIFYYIGGLLPGGNTRVALLPFKFLFTDSVIATSKQGMIIENFFRPSAMFLEPAHFSAYCSIGLLSLMFGRKRIDWKAIFVSLAICMTTSGIGIGSVVVIWGIYILYDLKTMNRKRMIKAELLIVSSFFIFVLLYSNFSFFRMALGRLSGPDNALSGRLSGRLFIEELSGKARWFGMGYKNFSKFILLNISYYFSSITELLYCQGIIGTVLFCVLYFLALIKMYRWNNQEHFAVMLLGIIYIVGTEIFSVNQLVRYIPFLF